MNFQSFSILIFLFSLNYSCETTQKGSVNYTDYSLNKDFDFYKIQTEIDILINELADSNLYIINGIGNQTLLEKLLDAKNDNELFFPYSNIDSIRYFVFNEFENESHEFSFVTVNEQLNLIIQFLNSPSNFEWVECGTPSEGYKMIFYLKGNNTAEVILSCNNKYIQCSPYNHLIKHGGLSSEGIKKIQIILQSLY